MPPCKQCGYPNRIGNNYCVKCGAEIQLTPEIQAAKAQKTAAENEQRMIYLLGFFFLFAVTDVIALYDFPPALIGGLIADAAITCFLWFMWRISWSQSQLRGSRPRGGFQLRGTCVVTPFHKRRNRIWCDNSLNATRSQLCSHIPQCCIDTASNSPTSIELPIQVSRLSRNGYRQVQIQNLFSEPQLWGPLHILDNSFEPTPIVREHPVSFEEVRYVKLSGGLRWT